MCDYVHEANNAQIQADPVLLEALQNVNINDTPASVSGRQTP